MHKTLLLYNILSGGVNARLINQILDILKSSGFSAEEIKTLKVGEAYERLKSYLDTQNIKPDLVIAVGGDGIINEAVNALAYTGIPLGIIPRGTGNAFAKDRKIPFYVKKAIDGFRNENIKTIDLGLINEEKYYLMMCSCGFDVKALSVLNPSLKKKFKILAYIYHGIKAFFTYKPVEIIMKINDENIFCKGYFCIASNVRSYGFPMAQIAPEASIDDGLIDICIFMSKDKISFIANILAIFVKMHINFKNVFYIKTASEIVIEQSHPKSPEAYNPAALKVQVDGDVYCNLPVRLRVAKKALKIFLP
ncbi:diacylglycerol kinase family lipid kinase [bacterium]|nr:diacylglycerol kinase family lipid kinase [bacterium]